MQELGFSLQPAQQCLGKRVELAEALSDRVRGRYIAVCQVLPDRVSGKPGSSRNLSNRQLLTMMPAPNYTQQIYVYHSSIHPAIQTQEQGYTWVNFGRKSTTNL